MMSDSILGGFGCNEFFSLLESPKLHKRLQLLAEKFLSAYMSDDVPNLDMSPKVLQTLATIHQVFSCVLVLLVPTPNYMGTSVSAVTSILSAAEYDDMEMMVALRLFLNDGGLWQGKVDEVLKVGTSSLKVGQSLSNLSEKLVMEGDGNCLSEAFTTAVKQLPDFRKALRKGATEKLEEMMIKRTVQAVTQMCAISEIKAEHTVNIHVCTQALDLFPTADSIMELKSRFLKWQKTVSHQLDQQILATTVEAIEQNLAVDDYKLPVDSLKKLVEQLFSPKVEKPTETMQHGRSMVWAVLRKLKAETIAVEADIEKQITFPVIPVAEKAAAASFEEALVPVILGHLRLFAEGGYVLQQMVKFSKFGADPAGRVRNDPRLGGLGTYLKQFDQFCASKAKLAKLMAELPETSDKQTLVGLDIPNLAAFQITADMLSAIRSVLEGWHKEATSSRARLSDITNDKHLPGTSWKEELSDKADFKTVQTHVAIKMDDDMSALPEAIKTLQEVVNNLSVWQKKLKFLKGQEQCPPEFKADLERFDAACAETSKFLDLAKIFQREGLLASAIVMKNKADGIKLARKELLKVDADGCGDQIHAALSAAARSPDLESHLHFLENELGLDSAKNFHSELLSLSLERYPVISGMEFFIRFNTACCKMDFLHACDLGVTSDWLGSLLFYLQSEKIRGHSKRIRCAKLYQNIKAYYDRAGVTDRLPKLLPGMLREEDRGKIKSPKLRAKAGEARALVGAAMELATKYLSLANPAEEAMFRGTEALQSMYACLSTAAWDKVNPSKTWTYRDESYGHTLALLGRRRGKYDNLLKHLKLSELVKDMLGKVENSHWTIW
ncbi:unnamed protein product [Symbiodinium sp. KB8]|nr:unnamed protein product [Symbiodinium sp. KB8]